MAQPQPDPVDAYLRAVEVRAVERFDPSTDDGFSSFASGFIDDAIADAIARP